MRDAFIGRTAPTLMELPHGAVIGSSSLRRQALIRSLRPDIEVITYRGLVDTRLRKLAEGQVDATLLAYAGLRRLGKADVVTELLDPERFPPAPAQGAICIESRVDNAAVNDLLAAINDADTFAAVSCERAFLAALDGSCRTPIAGLARTEAGRITFSGMILTPDGAKTHRVSQDGTAGDAALIGAAAGEKIRAEAGTAFFESWA